MLIFQISIKKLAEVKGKKNMLANNFTKNGFIIIIKGNLLETKIVLFGI